MRILRRRWKVVAAAVIVALLVALVTTTIARIDSESTFEATSVLFATGSAEALDPETLAALSETGAVTERVADRLDFEGDSLSLAKKVETHASKSGLFKITATSPDPKMAERLADLFALELIGFLESEGLIGDSATVGEEEPSAEEEDAADEQEAEQELAAMGIREKIRSLEAQLFELQAESARLTEQIASQVATAPNQLELSRLNLLLNLRQEGLGIRRQALQSKLDELTARLRRVTSDGTQRGEKKDESQSTAGTLRIIQNASAVEAQPSGLSAPETRASQLLFASAVGLLGGVGLAFLLERFDTRIRTREAAEKHFTIPVLAEIPLRTHSSGSPFPLGREAGAWADSFRLLVAGLEGWRPQGKSEDGVRPPATVLVTSSFVGEGTTTIVVNLASALAELGKQVLVLSCDLRRADIDRILGVADRPGIVDLLSPGRQTSFDETVAETNIRDVKAIPSGPLPEHPGELLGSERVAQLLGEARSRADIVLIDSSPLLVAGDASLLVRHVEAVLLVARTNVITTDAAARVSELLDRLSPARAGVVLNGVEGTIFQGA